MKNIHVKNFQRHTMLQHYWFQISMKKLLTTYIKYLYIEEIYYLYQFKILLNFRFLIYRKFYNLHYYKNETMCGYLSVCLQISQQRFNLNAAQSWLIYTEVR